MIDNKNLWNSSNNGSIAVVAVATAETRLVEVLAKNPLSGEKLTFLRVDDGKILLQTCFDTNS